MRREKLFLIVAALLCASLAAGVAIGRSSFSRFFRDDPNRVYHAQRVAYFHRFNRRADVLVLGDSLLADVDWHDLFPGVSIAGRAIRGETTGGALARIADLQAVHPRLTILLLGINDLDADDTPEQIFARYQRLVAELPGHVVAVELLPCTDLLRRCAEFTPEIARFNAMLRTLPADKVAVVTALRTMPDAYTYDGLHLTPQGFEALLQVIGGYIRAAEPKTREQ